MQVTQKVISCQSLVISKRDTLSNRFGSLLTELLAAPVPTLSQMTDHWRLAAPLAVAVSGGVDSMACTLLADDYARAHGGRVIALTVDHGLRVESRTEAEQVAAWMHAAGIEHHILTPSPQASHGNVQAQARARRYDALRQACAELGCSHLLLAHHADDQAETVALQRHRGETPPSRAGMPARRYQGNLALLRPLLGTRKRTLIEYLRNCHQPWIEDPTNASDRYARNRLRRTLTDTDITALWHEAQQAGKARHDAEAARNAWMQTHAQATSAHAMVSRTAWLNLPDLERMDYVSHAIRIIGRKMFRPRLHETTRLATRVANETSGVATLGHCRITWNAQQITITPEHPLDTGITISHIEENNVLVSPPFWWFSFPLHDT